jgi:hypothetical protein
MANIPDIEYIKTVTIAGQFLYTNTIITSFTANIDVEFVPDEIILRRTVLYNLSQGTGDTCCFVKSSLIDNHVLYSYVDVAAASDYTNTHFRNFKPIQGLYTFDVSTFSGNTISNINAINVTVAFTFEFIKYHPKK